jgi:hypothetical protein
MIMTKKRVLECFNARGKTGRLSSIVRLALLLLTFSIFVANSSNAATNFLTVTGKVTSSTDKSPLPGVNVTVKGTTVGTMTDANGDYTLSVDDANATLVFSFIGFTPQEIALNGQTVVDVSLVEESKKT